MRAKELNPEKLGRTWAGFLIRNKQRKPPTLNGGIPVTRNSKTGWVEPFKVARFYLFIYWIYSEAFEKLLSHSRGFPAFFKKSYYKTWLSQWEKANNLYVVCANEEKFVFVAIPPNMD